MNNTPLNATSVWIKLTEEQKKEMTPEAYNKLWNMLTDDEKAEILLIQQANQINADKERQKPHGAPGFYAREV